MPSRTRLDLPSARAAAFGDARMTERAGGRASSSPRRRRSPCSDRPASVTPGPVASSGSRMLDHGVGFAYLGNQMGGYGDARARELTEAAPRRDRRLSQGRAGPMAAARHRASPAAADVPGFARWRSPRAWRAARRTARRAVSWRPHPAAVPILRRSRVRATDLHRRSTQGSDRGRTSNGSRSSTTCCST